MLLSFGAREGAERGALERDVLESSLAPGLDRHVLLGALEALRGEALLFLHHVGGRYRCFRGDAGDPGKGEILQWVAE